MTSLLHQRAVRRRRRTRQLLGFRCPTLTRSFSSGTCHRCAVRQRATFASTAPGNGPRRPIDRSPYGPSFRVLRLPPCVRRPRLRPRLQGAPRVRDQGRVASSAECPNRAAHGQGNTCQQVRRSGPELQVRRPILRPFCPTTCPTNRANCRRRASSLAYSNPAQTFLRRPAPSRKTLRGGLSVRFQGGVRQAARTAPGVDAAVNWHEARDHAPLRGWSNAKEAPTLLRGA